MKAPPVQRSSLRKVKLATGEIQQSVNLPDDVFGEGLAVFDGQNTSAQLEEQNCFSYDKNTFQLLKKVQYPIEEGWGLTWDGSFLWMSDGSEILYRMDPETFAEAGETEVYDHQGAITQLNELEYIDGRIFANVYGQSSSSLLILKPAVLQGKLIFHGLFPSDIKEITTKY
jgi:glutamine cyclotransferase